METGLAFFLSARPFFFSSVEELLILLAGCFDFSFNTVYCAVEAGLLQLAFPDDDYAPSSSFEFAPDPLVAFLIPGDFGCPEFRVGLGNSVIPAALVTVPEAAVDEDDGVVLGENDVGSAG